MIFTLAFAGLISGGMLVGIFMLTKPIIEQNHKEELEEAIYQVLPGATTRKAFVLKEGKLSELPEGTKAEEGTVIYGGYDKAGQRVGYAVPIDGSGFQDVIKLIYGYDPKRKIIIGMKVLQSLETPGLGDKIVKDAAFGKNFTALKVDPIVDPVKHGTKTEENQVDCISGATISSKAVVRIINKGNKTWLEHMNAM